ncbi:MAG: hypothetical protein ACFFD5_04310 [Candidatus Thorarchaeota archaeon]
MNILSVIIVSAFYAYGLMILYVGFLAKKKDEKGAYQNNIVNGLILLLSITINLIIVNFSHLSSIDFIIFPFDIFIITFILLFLPFFYFLISRERKKVKLSKNLEMISEKQVIKQLPLKYEIYRKLSHLVVLTIIFFYFTLGFLVQHFFIYIFQLLPDFFSDLFFSVYNIEGDKMIFTQYLVVSLVGISLISLLTVDFVRILKPKIYPLKPVNRILREKELHMRLGPHISMSIGCFSIIILYGLFQPIGPLIICTSMTMGIFGDTNSNLIGRLLGKKKIRKTNKTYEGLFAGMITAFISGIIILILLREFFITSLLGFFLIPTIGALIIGLLDYLDLEIDDNLSYNFVLSTILFFVSFIII